MRVPEAGRVGNDFDGVGAVVVVVGDEVEWGCGEVVGCRGRDILAWAYRVGRSWEVGKKEEAYQICPARCSSRAFVACVVAVVDAGVVAGVAVGAGLLGLPKLLPDPYRCTLVSAPSSSVPSCYI